MSGSQLLRFDHLAGLFLVLNSVAMLPGLLMFWFRAGHKGGKPRSQTHYVIERSLIMTAVILAAIGFMLVYEAVEDPVGRALALVGATGFLFGGILSVTGEALGLAMGYEKVTNLENIYVISAFLAQAVIGWALLVSGLLPGWVGWASILWNLVWLVAIPLLSPGDIYFPVLHMVAPLLIGISLLLK